MFLPFWHRATQASADAAGRPASGGRVSRVPAPLRRARGRERFVQKRPASAPGPSGPAMKDMANRLLTVPLLAALLMASSGLLGGACAHQEYFPSSTIPKTDENQKIIDTVEQYRRRLLERNVEGLLVMASEKYFEDSGTPRSDDDYGYDGLKMVLSKRLSRVQSMRYEIEYRSIKHAG